MDIIGIGALNFDRLFKVDKLNIGDDEIFIKEEHEAPGGSGANTIYALGRLGLSAGFIGAVGADDEGRQIIKSFEETGVDTKGIVIKENERTSLILGFVDNIGERALYVSPRANSKLSVSDVNPKYFKSAKMLLLSSFVDDEQLELQKKMVRNSSKDSKIIFMPGALYCKKGYEKLKSILDRCELVFLNIEEMKMLLGLDHWSGSKKMIDSGIGTVAVTLGANGCFLRTRKAEYEIAAVPTTAVDTTGAGDAFAAGFIWAYVNGKPIDACGRAGNLVAAGCIKHLGARSGIPSASELNELLMK